MEHTVQYELFNGEYGLIKLNRPEKRNAISNEMAVALKKILLQAKQDAMKCLVITNTGNDMFCAGGDLIDLHSDLSPDEAFSMLYPMKEVLYELASFPVPTIAVLNGHALGGGCELATACDFRIAKNTADFGFVQSSLGIARVGEAVRCCMKKYTRILLSAGLWKRTFTMPLHYWKKAGFIICIQKQKWMDISS
ncbi:Enoyl-CoA hydratase [Lentibacillus sp. JNUCC-1]|uniref:enoyl-CoA hydratase/isomerase family protein n=1 Tax=Lentibacillus sp. JNUCC-1 TaxID=2654513 RepID=UPI00132AE7D2|nr:enoyl-CoA hydratase/isomerase family protein [Lentibacillus sp. JNUCC-1]MUV36234.1 Enoyl-CoA hydratase [Lentibacillus sp. JNUCC-1]